MATKKRARVNAKALLTRLGKICAQHPERFSMPADVDQLPVAWRT